MGALIEISVEGIDDKIVSHSFDSGVTAEKAITLFSSYMSGRLVSLKFANTEIDEYFNKNSIVSIAVDSEEIYKKS